jgi:hypothetical protein
MSDNQAPMRTIGEWNGQVWYWADSGKFTNPGPYYWDGFDNIHAGDKIAEQQAEIKRLRQIISRTFAIVTSDLWQTVSDVCAAEQDEVKVTNDSPKTSGGFTFIGGIA